MKGTFYTLLFCLASISSLAQDNPFSSINKEGQILTLSKGQYPEVHLNDSLQRIGSVVINMNTGKIHKFLDIDSVYNTFEISPTVTTRWYSTDPIEKNRAGISPYHFVYNSPIMMADPDGRDGIVVIDPVNHTVTMSTTVYLYGSVGADGTATANAYTQTFNALGNTMLVQDANDPNVKWTVKIDVKYVYDETIASMMNSGESAEIPEGANTLELRPGTYVDGATCLGCNDGYATSVPHHVFHETFHFLGFDERYVGFPILQYLGDVMSNATNYYGEKAELHIRGFHFADLLDYAIKTFGTEQESTNVVGTKTTYEWTYSEPYEYTREDGTVGMKRDAIQQQNTTIHQIDEGAIREKGTNMGTTKAEAQDKRTSVPKF